MAQGPRDLGKPISTGKLKLNHKYICSLTGITQKFLLGQFYVSQHL